jgi:hypothetical protein
MNAAEEAQAVRYMLDDLPREERDRIEDRYFTDDEYFESLSALETQLVRDWLAGSLAPEYAVRLEAWIRRDAVLPGHVALVKALSGPGPGWLSAARSRGSTRRLAC